jgi:hypothetical protein
MRIFRPTILLFALCCSAWSARAQTNVSQLGSAPRIAWLALEEPSPDDSVLPTPALPPIRQQLANASFALHHRADAVLLHLKDERNHVTLQVMSATGFVVQTTTRVDLSGGFHELILPNPSAKPALYALRLIINQEVITFSTVL